MRYGFGIDVGGTTIKLAFLDEKGTMKDKWEIPTRTEEGGKNVLPDIAAAVKAYMAKENLTNEQIIGIGIGVPGPISDEGIVNKCVNLGWDRVELHKELSALTGLNVKGGNDANVAALGECWLGGGQGAANLVMATLGTGVGGGIVVGGRIIAGFHGAGGEIGHFTVNPEEEEACGCGKHGCVEQYCSATGVVRLTRRYLAAHDTPSILRGTDYECKDVFAAAGKGDEAAKAVLEQVFELLGRFLANIACVTDPEVIVLGGGVSKAGQVLLDGVNKYYQKYAFHACRSTRITLATLGNDAGAYGAFKLALDEFGA
ncbi:MAG: ROK family glucokinase [Oscillospiraceae bacterium]|nr:ROK family glucokinase [Oscillospiraceae bacterium]